MTREGMGLITSICALFEAVEYAEYEHISHTVC